MLVSDSEPSFVWRFLLPRLATRVISLVSWLGRLSRALRKRALLATTVIDLLSVESSVLETWHINISHWLRVIYYRRCCSIAVCARTIFPLRVQSRCWVRLDKRWHLNHPLGVQRFWTAWCSRGRTAYERHESVSLSGSERQFDPPSPRTLHRAKSHTSPNRCLYQWFLLATLCTLVDFVGCLNHLSHH